MLDNGHPDPAAYSGDLRSDSEAADDPFIEALLLAADKRDRNAEHRDALARARDELAQERDRERGGTHLDPQARLAAHDRERAAVDRIRAGEDRDHAAGERAELRRARNG